MNIKKLFWWGVGLLLLVFFIKLVLKTGTTTIVNSNLTEVTRVVDGDTLMVEINGEKKYVRLIGIDSPEENSECFAKEASNKTKELVEGKKIILNSDPSQNNVDKYDRLLRYVRLEDGTFVNQKLVEEGYALEYTYKVPYQYQVEFEEAQKQAKINKKGMWGVCN